MAQAPAVQGWQGTQLLPYCITLLILASILSVTSQPKMAAGAPAITCIFDQEEGVRERTRAEVLPHQVSHLPLRICP